MQLVLLAFYDCMALTEALEYCYSAKMVEIVLSPKNKVSTIPERALCLSSFVRLKLKSSGLEGGSNGVITAPKPYIQRSPRVGYRKSLSRPSNEVVQRRLQGISLDVGRHYIVL